MRKARKRPTEGAETMPDGMPLNPLSELRRPKPSPMGRVARSAGRGENPLCHCVTSPPKGETQRQNAIKIRSPAPERGGGQGAGSCEWHYVKRPTGDAESASGIGRRKPRRDRRDFSFVQNDE